MWMWGLGIRGEMGMEEWRKDQPGLQRIMKPCGLYPNRKQRKGILRIKPNKNNFIIQHMKHFLYYVNVTQNLIVSHCSTTRNTLDDWDSQSDTLQRRPYLGPNCQKLCQVSRARFQRLAETVAGPGWTTSHVYTSAHTTVSQVLLHIQG